MNNPQFRKAIREGDSQAITEGLGAGFTLDYRFQKGQAPLHIATIAGNPETVAFLLSQGADVNVENDAWQTPLELAEKSGAKDVKAVLVKHGAKRGSEASLHSACFHGSIRDVRAHLAAGEDVNVRRSGKLPVCIALRKGHLGIAQLLLPKVQCAATESDGATPLHAVACWAKSDLLAALLKCGFKINAQDRSGETAICYAAKCGNAKAVQFLAENGAELDLVNPQVGHTPLGAALSDEQWDTACLLIDLGAATDIHDACEANHLQKVRQLIESGEDIDARNCVGNSALHIAVKRRLYEMAEFLLKAGANPNVQDTVWGKERFGGETPLHDAVAKADVRMVRTLMAYKADPTIKNGGDFSPLDIATARAQQHILRLLTAVQPQSMAQQLPAPIPSIGQLYTIEAVAQLLSVEADFVLNLIKERKLKTKRLGPDLLRIPSDSLADYLASLNSE